MKTPMYAGFSHRGLEVVGTLVDVKAFELSYVVDHGHKPWIIVPAPTKLVKVYDVQQAAQRVLDNVKLVGGKVVFT